jgi:hypothetical protein
MEKSIIVYLHCDRKMLPFAGMAKNILLLLLPTRQITFFYLRRYMCKSEQYCLMECDTINVINTYKLSVEMSCLCVLPSGWRIYRHSSDKIKFNVFWINVSLPPAARCDPVVSPSWNVNQNRRCRVAPKIMRRWAKISSTMNQIDSNPY